MGALEQLEHFLQDLIERPAWIMSPHRIQALELASALTRELEEGAVQLSDRIAVATDYEITLAPDDFARLNWRPGALERELTTYVTALAAERGLTLVREPRVHLSSSGTIEPGHIDVCGRFPRQRGVSDPRAVQQRTRLLLLDTDGQPVHSFAFTQSPLTVGRSSDNTIALPDTKVSRHHARVDCVAGRYILRDLGSTNGTVLNGADLETPSTLQSGDLIGVGLQRLRFVEASQSRDPA